MWKCQKCGEEVQADWDVCWNCTNPREGVVISSEPEPEPVVAPFRTCPRCNSEKVIPKISLSANALSNKVFAEPSEESHSNMIEACVCGACGYLELRVVDPAWLWGIYQDMLAAAQAEAEAEKADYEDEA